MFDSLLQPVVCYFYYYYIPAVVICLGSVITDCRLNFITKPYLWLLDRLFSVAPKFSYRITDENEQIPGRPYYEGLIEKQRYQLEFSASKARTTDVHYVSKVTSDMGQLFVLPGIECVIEDAVTASFQPQHLDRWNFLFRTFSQCDFQYRCVSLLTVKLMILYIIGCVFRYVFLAPVRLGLLVILLFLAVPAMLLTAFALPRVSRVRQKLMNFLGFCATDLFRKYNGICGYCYLEENRPKNGHLMAINHTAPMEDPSPAVKSPHKFSLIVQRQKGFIGLLFNAYDAFSPLIVFDRGAMRDRQAVIEKFKEYSEDSNAVPMVLFPEGFCVNNTAIMRFRKSVIGCVQAVYPVAIRYRAQFRDPFWGAQLYLVHVWQGMTSWAMVNNLWFLPPMHRLPAEGDSEFAERIRLAIAKQANLKLVDWSLSATQSFSKKHLQALLEKKRADYANHLVVSLNLLCSQV